MLYRNLFVFTVLFLLATSCSTHTEVKEIYEINVTKVYPVKELLVEDIADVEYLSLEVDDEYLYSSRPRLITDDYIICANQPGDILVFDRFGKPFCKFNHKGEGAHEYNYLFGNIVYDADADDLFISTGGRIQVYSLCGEYKRSLAIMEHSIIGEMVDFDADCLLCFENYTMPTPFSLISKKDGHIVESIPVKAEEKIPIYVQRRSDDMIYTHTPSKENLVRNGDGFLLTDHSLDTVYRYGKDRTLTPVWTRTPSVRSMDPVVFLNSYLETSGYLFFQSTTVEFDWDTQQGFPVKNLFVDKADGNIYEQKIIWNDYKGREIPMSPGHLDRTTTSKMGALTLNLAGLQDALEEGRLSGRLKELVSTLDEDANDVLVLLHFK